MQINKPATLADIGRAAGVSPMAVSAVVNGAKSNVRVSAQTRQRILEEATRLKYRPNAVGQGLRLQRTNSIGIVVEMDQNGQLGLVLHELLDGLFEGCFAGRQKATVFPIRSWDSDISGMIQNCNGLVDGYILLRPSLSEQAAKWITDTIPVVAVHNSGAIGKSEVIDVDNFAGAYQLVNYLANLGHKRVATIAGHPGWSGADSRLAGYQQAVLDRGLGFDSSLVTSGDYTYKSGFDVVKKFIRTRATISMPTAIFCANDEMACGAIDSLLAEGISVPGDISVAGFDGVPIRPSNGLQMTSVRQPLHSMAFQAVNYVLDAIDRRHGLKQLNPFDKNYALRIPTRCDISKATVHENQTTFIPELVIGATTATPCFA